MSSLVRLVLTSNGTKADFQSQSDMAMGGLDAVNSVVDYLSGLSGGQRIGALLTWKVGAIQAAGTLTVAAGGSANNEACTILNVTLTGKTASTANNEFTVSATAATQAANMAAAINASTDLAGKVTASANLGVVTITSIVPGLLGNGFQLDVGTLANVTKSAFAGGTDGTAYSQDLR